MHIMKKQVLLIILLALPLWLKAADVSVTGLRTEQMVEKLKQNEEYYFKMVDCSFGGKYPVAGLYIIDKNTGRFGFKMGAHPDME